MRLLAHRARPPSSAIGTVGSIPTEVGIIAIRAVGAVVCAIWLSACADAAAPEPVAEGPEAEGPEIELLVDASNVFQSPDAPAGGAIRRGGRRRTQGGKDVPHRNDLRTRQRARPTRLLGHGRRSRRAATRAGAPRSCHRSRGGIWGPRSASTGPVGIYVLDGDDSDLRYVGWGLFPTWSPDVPAPRAVAYPRCSRDERRRFRRHGTAQVKRWRLGHHLPGLLGRAVRRLDRVPARPRVRQELGDRKLRRRSDPAVTEPEVIYTAPAFLAWHPDGSSDGSHLVFTGKFSPRDGIWHRRRIFTVSLETGDARQLILRRQRIRPPLATVIARAPDHQSGALEVEPAGVEPERARPVRSQAMSRRVERRTTARARQMHQSPTSLSRAGR
jgi:hypothetical protein